MVLLITGALVGMVFVPGGTFIMGDTKGGGNDREKPEHSVVLDSFYIGKYEVTQSKYENIMGLIKSTNDNAIYPIRKVTWYSAIKYCNLLSLAEGLTPVYTINGSTDPAFWGNEPTIKDVFWDAVICDWKANGYRLPTEAEWEYAARGATNKPDYLYSGSDDNNKVVVAWYEGNSNREIHQVGKKTANSLGIYDMSGNVWEWCWDWYDAKYYSNDISYNPTGPENGTHRVLRGGSCDSNILYCRISYRHLYRPETVDDVVGFRVCRSAL